MILPLAELSNILKKYVNVEKIFFGAQKLRESLYINIYRGGYFLQINEMKHAHIETIQPVTNSEQIIEVIHAAFKRYETDPMPSSALSETSTTIEKELKDGILIFGSYIKEALVGVIKVTLYSDHLYFSRLAVIPSAQGKGIASAIIAYIENFAIKQQIHHITCKVRKSEADNIRLYTKLGYQITKEEMTTSPLGFVMSAVTMEKNI